MRTWEEQQVNKAPTDWFYTCVCGNTFKRPLLDQEIIEYLKEYSPASSGLCPKCMEPVMLLQVATYGQPKRTKTLQSMFAAFHSANPQFMDALIDLADELISQGVKRVSVTALYHKMRNDPDLRLVHGPDDHFKLPTNYASRYIREILKRRPDLVPYFRLLRLKTE